MRDAYELKLMLKRFETLWNESLNGYYKNQGELSSLSKKIRDMHLEDAYLNSCLSTAELIFYRYALLLANYK